VRINSKVLVEGYQLVHNASTGIFSLHATEHLNPKTLAQKLGRLRNPRQVLAQAEYSARIEVGHSSDTAAKHLVSGKTMPHLWFARKQQVSVFGHQQLRKRCCEWPTIGFVRHDDAVKTIRETARRVIYLDLQKVHFRPVCSVTRIFIIPNSSA
jgi:hypothetical protein